MSKIRSDAPSLRESPRPSVFDASMFGRAFRARLITLGMSYRDAAKEIGASCATLNRIARGHPPDVENYIRVSEWLTENGIEPVWLGNRKDGSSPQNEGR